MITEALPPGATQRGLHIHSTTPTHSLTVPRKHFPSLRDLILKLPNLTETWNYLFPKCAHSTCDGTVICRTGSGSGIVSTRPEISANGLKTHSRDTQCVCIGFVWRRVGWGGTYVWPCVQGSALLNSKAWECGLLFTARLWGLFDMRKCSVWQKPSYPLCPCFCLCRLFISSSLSLCSGLLVFFPPRAAFWGEYYSDSAEKSAQSSKNKVKCSDRSCWPNQVKLIPFRNHTGTLNSGYMCFLCTNTNRLSANSKNKTAADFKNNLLNICARLISLSMWCEERTVFLHYSWAGSGEALMHF